MHGSSDGSAAGDGWVGATKDYVGGLAAQFVLPDEGRFDEVAADLPAVFAELDGGQLGPSWCSPASRPASRPRSPSALQAARPDRARSSRATCSASPTTTALVVDRRHPRDLPGHGRGGHRGRRRHARCSGHRRRRPGEPVPVVLDRPFLFRIYDPATDATLFLGRVTDPTAVRRLTDTRGRTSLIEPRTTASARSSNWVGSALTMTTAAPKCFATGTTSQIG